MTGNGLGFGRTQYLEICFLWRTVVSKVSIITVCYNSAATIRDTIDSVLSQDYPDLEYIIIDGASSDSTMDIVNEYSSRISKIISEPDDGIYSAMNKGISYASGEIVSSLH